MVLGRNCAGLADFLHQGCTEYHSVFAQWLSCCHPRISLLHMQIHWFSIINSCVTVLLLTGFLATILMRVLKNDFIKYTRDDEAGENYPPKQPTCRS